MKVIATYLVMRDMILLPLYKCGSETGYKWFIQRYRLGKNPGLDVIDEELAVDLIGAMNPKAKKVR